MKPLSITSTELPDPNGIEFAKTLLYLGKEESKFAFTGPIGTNPFQRTRLLESQSN